MSKANRHAASSLDHADDHGFFPVVEAILVAVIVLGALIFFTSLKRPTTGSEPGGLDLAQVSADTLEILKVRHFQVAGFRAQPFSEWVTNLTKGDAATTTLVDTFMKQVLPTGVSYSLRLDNGVSSLQLLPTSAAAVPASGRGAEVLVSPNWVSFRDQTATRVVTPGQIVAANDALTASSSPTYQCYESPAGSSKTPSGAEWTTRWQSAIQSVAKPTNGKGNTTAVGSNQQIPMDLPLGRWRLSTSASVSSHCTAGTVSYVLVAPKGYRTVNDGAFSTSNATLTSFTAHFTAADLGSIVTDSSTPTGFPAGQVRIVAILTTNAVTMSASPATGPYSNHVITITPDPAYVPYALELVVWFGA